MAKLYGYVSNDGLPNYDDIIKSNMSPDEKVVAIKQRGQAYNDEIDRQHRKEMAKLYGGAALQIGSAFIPGTLGLKLAGGAIKGLTPYVGRKIAQNVATGVTSGLTSGAVEGLGRGLMENQNPLKTMVTDSVAGGLLGVLGGYGLGKVAQRLNTQTAWHGSPYKFDRFSNEAIGTGEGAQAHGYGHYAAKNKDVADRRYAKRLSRGSKGFVYKLLIPKDNLLLREGVEFEQQPKRVQKAILKKMKDKQIRNLNDESFRRLYTFTHEPEELAKYGVKGVSYNGGIDGEARVIFNPDDIDIIPYYDNPQNFKERFVNLLNR